MKRILLLLVSIGLLVGCDLAAKPIPEPFHAQILALKKRVHEIDAQLAELQRQQSALQAEKQENCIKQQILAEQGAEKLGEPNAVVDMNALTVESRKAALGDPWP